VSLPNWYEIFSISCDEELETIQYILKGREQDEEHSKFNNPNYDKNIRNIIQAREAFKDQKSREDYDYLLKNSTKPKPEPINPIEKYLSWVIDHYNNNRYGRALTAWEEIKQEIEQLKSPEGFEWGARVYQKNKQFEEAVKYIKRAFAIARGTNTEAKYLIHEAEIYKEWEQYAKEENISKLRDSEIETLEYAISIANDTNDKKSEALSYGILAGILYFLLDGVDNTAKAEYYAKQAISIDIKQSDAIKVLYAIRKQREAYEKFKKKQYEDWVNRKRIDNENKAKERDRLIKEAEKQKRLAEEQLRCEHLGELIKKNDQIKAIEAQIADLKCKIFNLQSMIFQSNIFGYVLLAGVLLLVTGLLLWIIIPTSWIILVAVIGALTCAVVLIVSKVRSFTRNKIVTKIIVLFGVATMIIGLVLWITVDRNVFVTFKRVTWIGIIVEFIGLSYIFFIKNMDSITAQEIKRDNLVIQVGNLKKDRDDYEKKYFPSGINDSDFDMLKKHLAT